MKRLHPIRHRVKGGEPNVRFGGFAVTAVVSTPLPLLEAVAAMGFPPKADRRLARLMDRNTEGLLSPDERDEIDSLVELSEAMSLVRAQALHVLQRSPV